MRTIKEIIIHASDKPPTYDYSQITYAEIDKWHKAKGWDGFGYHYMINRNGLLLYGRPLYVKGSHALKGGHNSNSVGIVLIGGYKGIDDFTDKQWITLEVLLNNFIAMPEDLQKEQQIKIRMPMIVIGHRDVDNSKECPCFDVKPWWKDILSKQGVSSFIGKTDLLTKENDMNKTKTLWESKTFYGLVAAGIAAIVNTFTSYSVTEAMQGDITAVITYLVQYGGLVFALWGRIKASKRIG